MSEITPARRDFLKYAGAAGGAVVAGGWLGRPVPAFADPLTPSSPSTPAAAPVSGTPLDTLVFGNTASENAHALTATLSDPVASGGLNQTARVFHPTSPAGFWGGTASFTMKCSPTDTTYVTVKLWGDEFDPTSVDNDSGNDSWRLQLFCEGLQVGYEDQGAIDSLDILDTAPRTPGRFFFHTIPLPEKLTTGKTSVSLEIRSMGRIWSYGNSQSTLYYNQTTDSRGVYRLYTHTDPFLVLPTTDVQGPIPVPGTRTTPTQSDVYTQIAARVQSDQNYLFTQATPTALDGWAMQSVAEGYLWPGSPMYGSENALDILCQAIDGRYWAWQADATVLTGSDQQWQGFGRVGLVLALLWEHLGDRLSQPLAGAPTELQNTGFEQGGATPLFWTDAAGWGMSADASWARDTTVSHTGTASLRMSLSGTGGKCSVYSTPSITVTPGTYTFGAWVKTDGAATQTFDIDPLFFDANNNVIGGDHRTYTPTGAHDWAYVSVDVAVPTGATQAALYLYLNGAGTVWIDDVVCVPPPGPTTTVPVRTDAYTQMLLASREYWRQHFPHYSNQTQICAIGLYQVNRALGLLGYADVWPEAKARGYLYESIGLVPYSGPEDAAGTPNWVLGKDYYEVTAKGLTRELGYVGNYGEVTDWLVMMYESVTRGYQAQDAPELAKQMIKMVRTRALFRIVDVDGDHDKVSRLETVIGWRNEAYPGIIDYAQRVVWDSNPVQAATVFGDPEIIAWTQEMVADGQFWIQFDLLTSNSWDRVGLNALRFVARDWPAFQALPPTPGRLPTNWDQPDFVFTDEDAGAIAIKNGRELLFASLYWRARQGVNNYARIHHVTESDQHSATIREVSAGATGNSFTAYDWVLWDYAINDPGAGGIPPGGFPPPGPTLHNAQAGTVYYQAPVPAGADPTLGVDFVGVEEMLVGHAPFYVMQYGPYLVAMNSTADTTYTLPPRPNFGPANDLRTRRLYPPNTPVRIPPKTTLVLYRQQGPTRHR